MTEAPKKALLSGALHLKLCPSTSFTGGSLIPLATLSLAGNCCHPYSFWSFLGLAWLREDLPLSPVRITSRYSWSWSGRHQRVNLGSFLLVGAQISQARIECSCLGVQLGFLIYLPRGFPTAIVPGFQPSVGLMEVHVILPYGIDLDFCPLQNKPMP